MHVLQCHGNADPMVPFVFGAQTAEKMKSLVNPSNITFKTYHGLSHGACPEVRVEEGGGGGVRGESHHCLCHILTVFCLFLSAQEMVDIKRFIEKQLPPLRDE